MQLIEEALEKALVEKSAASWDEVDRLARQAIRRKFTSPADVKRLIGIALRRAGIDAEDDDFRDGRWTDALLARILEEMDRSEALRSSFASIPHIVHSINRDGRLIAVTESWLELLGYRHEYDVIGRRSAEFLSPESQEKAKGVIQKFWQEGVVSGCEYVMIRANGKPLDVVFDAVGVRNKNGEVAASICAISEK
jgi:PAS domain S-box-containing protein